MYRPPLPEYGSEVGGNLKFAGVDQGIDFTGSGPVYALGSGTITRIQNSGSGWPGQGALLSYSIPSLNKFVYIAEDFVSKAGLKVGDPVKKGDVLGVATGSGMAPGIETGWADAGGHAAAPYAGHSATALGADFQAFVKGSAPGGGSGGLTSPGGLFGNPFGQGGVLSQQSVVPGVPTVAKAGHDAKAAIDSVPKFLKKITSGDFWIRVLEIIGGSVLFLAGLYLLVKDVGLGVNVPKPAPVARVAEAV